MKKWSDIVQLTLDKLNMSSEEANRQGYNDKMRSFANECLNLIANDVKPKLVKLDLEISSPSSVVTLGDDFLSFSNLSSYKDGEKTGENFIFGYNRLFFKEPGNYIIYYNAIWDNITSEDIKTNSVLEIEPSVLNCLPSYIASQLLSEDNMTRSAILRNEFESMVERLDLSEIRDHEVFTSEGGWY